METSIVRVDLRGSELNSFFPEALTGHMPLEEWESFCEKLQGILDSGRKHIKVCDGFCIAGIGLGLSSFFRDLVTSLFDNDFGYQNAFGLIAIAVVLVFFKLLVKYYRNKCTNRIESLCHEKMKEYPALSFDRHYSQPMFFYRHTRVTFIEIGCSDTTEVEDSEEVERV